MKRHGSSSFGGANLSLANFSQTDSTRNQDSILYFVMPTGLTVATCSTALSAAKRFCEDYSLVSEWVDEDKIKKMKPNVNNIFVLDPFSGPAYNFLEDLCLKSKKLTIIGPQCVQYALNRMDLELPILTRGFPFYTMGMRNICVTFTGFSADEQKELTDLVQKMNGIVSKSFAVACTHVVAKHVITPKCTEAFKKEVPVMSANWVHQVWKDSQTELIDSTDSKYADHTCGTFHNVTICVSQIPSATKNTIEKVIVSGGGIYSKDLKRDVTQVLIVPNASGEKYKFAQQWGIPIVIPDWILKSKEAGHVVPFDGFMPPKRPIYNSTQIDNMEPKFPDVNLTALSVDGETHDVDVVESSRFSRCSVLTVEKDVITQEHLNTLRRMPDDVLSNCKLYLNLDCDSTRFGELKLILMEREIDYCTDYSESVTHVICCNGNLSETESRAMKRCGNSVHVVSFEWLLQCAEKGQHVDEANFKASLPEIKRLIQNHDAIDKESLRMELNQSLGLQEPPNAKSNGAHASGSGRSSGDKMQRNASQSAFFQPECVQRAKSIPNAVKDLEAATTGTEDISITVAADAFVFAGFKFAVKLQSTAECNQLTAIIKEASGEILSDKDLKATDDLILILPPVYQPHGIKAWQSFTKFWVNEVIEEKTIDIPEKFYHLPLASDDNLCELLNGVVLAISAYPTPVKEYITQVATHLGAKVQEVFSRKNTQGSLKSTHLICGVTDNDKYRAAQRWGTPVVGCNWILECMRRQCRLDHGDFLLQADNSDVTASVYMKTPGNSEKFQLPHARTDKNIQSNQNSVIPGTDKVKTSEFLRPQPRIHTKLNFDSEDSKVSKPLERVVSKVAPRNPVPEETVDSPLVRPGMTREGSRQLKRAIEWACQDSPPGTRKQRRKSTPISEIMRKVNEAIDQRTRERRRELNLSPMFCDRGKQTEIQDQIPVVENLKDDDYTGEMPGQKLVFENVDSDEDDDIKQNLTNKRVKLNKQSTESTESAAASSTGRNSKSSTESVKSGSSTRSTRSNAKQENKFDYLTDFVAGVHDDGEAGEIQWDADKQNQTEKKRDSPPAQIPEVEQVPVELPEPVQEENFSKLDLPDDRSHKNVKKKRGTGSSVASNKSSVSTTSLSNRKKRENGIPKMSSKSPTSNTGNNTIEARTRLRRKSTFCFSFSGGTAQEKESYHSIVTRLGGTISSVEHFDKNADALIASKVARSEKTLGSIAAGKPILHPSYVQECDNAGKFLDFEEHIWKEMHGNSSSDRNMINVAYFWYKRRQSNSDAGPYEKFVARIYADKLPKREAYVRLVEAGGGRVVGEDEEPNIIFGDDRSMRDVEIPANVMVKTPMFLNDVIINYGDESLRQIE